MSYRQSFSVRCDYCGGQFAGNGSAYIKPSDLWEHVRIIGWTTIDDGKPEFIHDKGHLCPECSPKRAKWRRK